MWAKYFAEFHSAVELQELLVSSVAKVNPKLILGGGSNILFTKNYEGLVLCNRMKGKEILREDEANVFVKVAAGEVWHEFVQFCIEKNLSGVENLSLIPGSVGAAPMQNIGAYGVELKQVFYSLDAIDILSGEPRIFSHEECRFGYRESVFKNIYKNKFCIVSVTFQLKKIPVFNTSYGAIEEELKRMGVSQLNIKAISEAVCNIRRSKLPDPLITGNAGSFFKNPEVEETLFSSIKAQFPGIIAHPSVHGKMKLAAGWMIEQCGWKGKSIGKAGVHVRQALVIVNLGGAKGSEIYSLSLHVKKSVMEKFGVELETEVNIM